MTDWVYEEEFGLRDGFRWSSDGTRLAYWQFDMTGVGTFLLINDTGYDDALDAITTVNRRSGTWGGVIAGTSEEVADGLGAEVERGVDGFVLQFGDFGTPETIQRFMTEVAPAVRERR